MPGQAVRILSWHMLLLKNDFSRVCTEPDSDLIWNREWLPRQVPILE